MFLYTTTRDLKSISPGWYFLLLFALGLTYSPLVPIEHRRVLTYVRRVNFLFLLAMLFYAASTYNHLPVFSVFLLQMGLASFQLAWTYRLLSTYRVRDDEPVKELVDEVAEPSNIGPLWSSLLRIEELIDEMKAWVGRSLKRTQGH